MTTTSALAVAHANIALVKYWGKRDFALNLPAEGSLSASIAALNTRTLVSFNESLASDEILLDGIVLEGRKRERIVKHINIFRERTGVNTPICVDSHNSFPTAAGLASSASGFAALTLALNTLFEQTLSPKELSAIARLGSGSAARSLFGGYVEMHAGNQHDTAYAEAIATANDWPLKCTIAITEEGEKGIPSTDGMEQTMKTSPYYKEWLKTVPVAIEDAKNAIKSRDFEKLAEVAEGSAMQMHASAIAARPGILYWNGVTVQLIHLVRKLRTEGLHVFFSIDAGPHVKIFSTPEDQYPLIREIREIPGVIRFIATEVGGEPRAIDVSRLGMSLPNA